MASVMNHLVLDYSVSATYNIQSQFTAVVFSVLFVDLAHFSFILFKKKSILG